MNKIAKPLAISATVLYLAAVFFTAWYTLVLPERLNEVSMSFDLITEAEIRPEHHSLLAVVGITLLLGVIALMAQLVANRNQDTNVVYVEKSKETKITAKLDESDEEDHNISAMSEELLAAIRQAAAGNEHPDKKLEKALRVVCSQLQASQGAVYVTTKQPASSVLELRAGYALMKPDSQVIRYELGEGLPGQVAKEAQTVNLNTVPDGYIKILSGLGSSSPKHLLLVPIMANNSTVGVVEIASFNPLHRQHEALVKQSFEIMAKIISESSQQAADESPNEENLINEPVKR